MPVELDKILSDNHSGSVILTKNTLQLYRELLKNADVKKIKLEEVYEQFQDISKKILKHQPNMVLLRKSTSTIQIYFKRLAKSDKDPDQVLKAVEKKITAVEKEIESRMEKIAHTGSRIIAPTNKIMTISNSTLVRNIFKTTHNQKRKFEVYCCKSHPPDEGVVLAEFLDKSGIKTTLISDSQMGVFMDQMNLVLIGADRIYGDGFVNKAGTLALCLTANYYNIPVYLAADTTKILSENERSIKLNSQDRKELYNGNRKKLAVENIYYEKVPIKLIHKVICEDSIFDTVDFINWYLKE
jgi:translation initiation factor 2B subunit (eIF-2B alpha/beta/delta family)